MRKVCTEGSSRSEFDPPTATMPRCSDRVEGDLGQLSRGWPSPYSVTALRSGVVKSSADRGTRLRLALYLSPPVDHGGDAAAQQTQAGRWAKEHGHVLASTVVRQPGVGAGYDLEGLSRALTAVRDGEADGLLVLTLSVLGTALAVQETVLAHCWRHGGRVFTVDTGEVLATDRVDATRRGMRQMAAALFELDSAYIVKRLRDGRAVKVAQGRYAGGQPAFGLRVQGGELVVDEQEAAVLAQMRAWQAEGVSFREISRRLNASGAVSKRGGSWFPTSVSRILTTSDG